MGLSVSGAYAALPENVVSAICHQGRLVTGVVGVVFAIALAIFSKCGRERDENGAIKVNAIVLSFSIFTAAFVGIIMGTFTGPGNILCMTCHS